MLENNRQDERKGQKARHAREQDRTKEKVRKPAMLENLKHDDSARRGNVRGATVALRCEAPAIAAASTGRPSITVQITPSPAPLHQHSRAGR
jgi:hypothetical protein